MLLSFNGPCVALMNSWEQLRSCKIKILIWKNEIIVHQRWIVYLVSLAISGTINTRMSVTTWLEIFITSSSFGFSTICSKISSEYRPSFENDFLICCGIICSQISILNTSPSFEDYFLICCGTICDQISILNTAASFDDDFLICCRHNMWLKIHRIPPPSSNGWAPPISRWDIG